MKCLCGGGKGKGKVGGVDVLRCMANAAVDLVQEPIILVHDVSLRADASRVHPWG